jgi:hypothetical protein
VRLCTGVFLFFPILVTAGTKDKDMDGRRGVSVIVLYEHRGKPLFQPAAFSLKSFSKMLRTN